MNERKHLVERRVNRCPSEAIRVSELMKNRLGRNQVAHALRSQLEPCLLMIHFYYWIKDHPPLSALGPLA